MGCLNIIHVSFNDDTLFRKNNFTLEEKEIYLKRIIHLEEENKFLKHQIKKLSNN